MKHPESFSLKAGKLFGSCFQIFYNLLFSCKIEPFINTSSEGDCLGKKEKKFLHWFGYHEVSLMLLGV